jgi:hypothetical protein
MPKIFYTERDIDDLHARGVTSLEVNDNVVLTDLARERMLKYGIAYVKGVSADVRLEALVYRIKAEVLPRLNRPVDPSLLDAAIRKVLRDMKL